MGRKGKVLVTGSEGFIGSHLVEELLTLGYEVRAFVYYNFSNQWGWLDTFPRHVLRSIDIFPGDIRDMNCVRKATRGIKKVFHLAALIGIPYSYDSPQSYVETNVNGTLNVLQASLDQGVETILVTSTSEVYGTALYTPIDETHPKQGQSPYAASKISADYMAESFYRSFDLPVIIARPFNTYGPRQSARAIIPTIITQALANKGGEIKLGALSPKRDMCYVKDTVSAMAALISCKAAIGESVNIATNSEISIGGLAKKILKLMKRTARISMDEKRLRPEKSEVMRLLGGSSKLFKLTGWKPSYTLDEGLRETIDWFMQGKNALLYKPELYNV